MAEHSPEFLIEIDSLGIALWLTKEKMVLQKKNVLNVTTEVHFFVHLFNNVKPQQLQTSTTRTSEARPKRKEKTKQTSRISKTH